MKSKQSNRIRKAKRTLEKMLDSLEPYLPKRDLRPPPPPKAWRLPTCTVPKADEAGKPSLV